MNFLPLLGCALVSLGLIKPVDPPPAESALDDELLALDAEYFSLEAALDDELFLVDEIDLVLEEFLDRHALRVVELGARRVRGGEGARSTELARETQLLAAREAELAALLARLTEVQLDVEIAHNETRLNSLRGRLDAEMPGSSWRHRSDESLLRVDLAGLGAALEAVRGRESLLSNAIAAEREMGHAAGAMAAQTFVAGARSQLLASATREERYRMASRSHDCALRHLSAAARSLGLGQEVELRAAETRLSSLISTHQDWPGRAGALDELGTTRLALGRQRAAAEAYVRLVVDHPQSPQAPAAAAQMLTLRFEFGDYEGVLDAAGRLDGLLAESEVAYYVGIAALSMGDAHTARLALESVPADSPHAAYARLSLATAIAATGDGELARRLLTEISLTEVKNRDQEEVRDRATLALGLLYYESGLFQDSHEILAEVPWDSPVGAEAALAAARGQIGMGDFDGARERLGELRERRSGTVHAAQALMAIAELEAHQGDLVAAESALDRLVSDLGRDERLIALTRTDRTLSEIRAEQARVAGMQTELLELHREARGASHASIAADLGGLLPQVRALALDARELAAIPPSGTSSQLPLLLKTAEMRLAQIGLLRMEEARNALSTLTQPREDPLRLALKDPPAPPKGDAE